MDRRRAVATCRGAFGALAVILVLLLSRRYASTLTRVLVALTVPDDLGAALRVPTERLGAELALAAAMRLFEEKRISFAKAAEGAGLDRLTFTTILAARGIPTATFEPADVDAWNDAPGSSAQRQRQ